MSGYKEFVDTYKKNTQEVISSREKEILYRFQCKYREEKIKKDNKKDVVTIFVNFQNMRIEDNDLSIIRNFLINEEGWPENKINVWREKHWGDSIYHLYVKLNLK
jgi:hypothetical protein